MLSDLGLRVQLGHDGGTCPCPSPGHSLFTVIDISGIHRVQIDYCDCQIEKPLERRVQLLRKGWFPATLDRPQSVITFDCLSTFHESTLQGKGNLYDFYHMLLRKTDNANIQPSIVSEENLFFKSVSDALFQVSIPGNESYFSSLAKYNGIQTSWAGTGPFWNCRHIPGRFNC